MFNGYIIEPNGPFSVGIRCGLEGVIQSGSHMFPKFGPRSYEEFLNYMTDTKNFCELNGNAT
jgi:hypothetical protein